MRIGGVAFLLAVAFGLGGVARADDAKPEDLVGTWRGKAAWKSCTVDGGAQAAVGVTWKESLFHVDLSGARDDLGDVALSPRGDGTLFGSRDDLKVTWKLGASATLTLVTDAGCKATLTLARDGSKLASCDRLLALSSIEATCDAAGDGRDAHLSAARGKLASWKKLAGKARKDAEQACTKDGDAIAASLAQNGCLPAGGVAGSGLPECDAYVGAMRRFSQCSQLPVQSKQSIEQALSQMGDTWRNLPPEGRQQAAEACKQGTDAIRQAAASMGCQI
jgi:hypothetical protein